MNDNNNPQNPSDTGAATNQQPANNSLAPTDPNAIFGNPTTPAAPGTPIPGAQPPAPPAMPAQPMGMPAEVFSQPADPTTANAAAVPPQMANPSQPPTPTFVPPGGSPPPETVTMVPNSPEVSSATNMPSPTTDSAPTDLSQLTANEEPVNVVAPVFANQVPNTEPSPVAQSSATTSAAQAPASSSKLPFILIGIGIFAVIAATAASAYFILGIGQPAAAPPTSVPAESANTQLTNPPAPQNPATAPVPAPPTATASAVPNTSPTASASPRTSARPSASPKTSAVDTLIQGKNSPAPTAAPPEAAGTFEQPQ